MIHRVTGKETLAITLQGAVEYGFELAPGARLNCTLLTFEDANAHINIEQSPGSHLQLTRVIMGKPNVAYREVHHSAGNAESIKARFCYLHHQAEVKEHVLTTHAGKGGRSEQNYAGCVDSGAKIFSTARIYVDKGAPETDADLHFEHLMLERGTRVLTKPELEIYTDAVKCSHGAALSEFDPEVLFYLNARGLSVRDAKSLLLSALAKRHLSHVGDLSAFTQICQHLSKYGLSLQN